jgi:hypothetical protein
LLGDYHAIGWQSSGQLQTQYPPATMCSRAMARGGQWCTSPGYAAVHESVAEDRIFFARLVSVSSRTLHTSQTFAQLDLLAMPSAQKLDTHHKALTINLDTSTFGSFAEIGAGQEVARWFLLVGGASGTVAKTISALRQGSQR